MLELMKQMGILAGVAQGADALEVERKVTAEQRSASFPVSEFGAPLAGSLLAWIDKEVDGGQTKEEWKGISETNKILGLNPPVPIDGICVRVGALRCHSQAVTIKMTKDVPMADIEAMLAQATPWTRLIENHKEPTIQYLTPAAVSGTLEIPVGRLHKLQMGPTFLGGFTVGDQLLWGAAEPLRRMVQIVRRHLGK
jgi:aspartate-semialdehyde dehydrogenase